MRTGVLTFHRCINYGSYWQACCLVKGLRERGHDAVLLEHQSPRINRAEWQCALWPVQPSPVSRRDRLRYGLKMLRFFRDFARLPRSAPFPLEDPRAMEEFGLVVVGSDEVWNLCHPWYRECPLFYGVGLRTRYLASYAASFGNYHASAGLEEPWVDFLRAFDWISVRDLNSQQILRDAVGREAELVLDPCLQFELQPEGRWRGPRRRFVAIYGHHFSEPFVRDVRGWAERRGYPLVSIGYRNDWADAQWLTAGPHDFAHFMARAEAVVTNFFHGCVFALRGRKPFAAEMTAYRSIKVANLMETVGEEKRLIGGDTPAAMLAECLEAPPDAATYERIEALRQAGELYLQRLKTLQRRPVARPAGVAA